MADHLPGGEGGSDVLRKTRSGRAPGVGGGWPGELFHVKCPSDPPELLARPKERKPPFNRGVLWRLKERVSGRRTCSIGPAG